MESIKDLDDLDLLESEEVFIKSADMNKTVKNKGGRPKKSPEKRASEQIFVNLTKDEKLKIESYANELGISISAMVKIALVKFMDISK